MSEPNARSTHHPYPLAMVVCDSVIEDAASGKKSLIGIFGSIMSEGFPVNQSLGIYARLTDAEGWYVFRFELVHASQDKVLGHFEFEPALVANRLEAIEIVSHGHFPLPTPGVYEIRLYANGSYVARASFTAQLIKKEG